MCQKFKVQYMSYKCYNGKRMMRIVAKNICIKSLVSGVWHRVTGFYKEMSRTWNVQNCRISILLNITPNKGGSLLLICPKNQTLVRIRTYTLNGLILVRKMGLSLILDFCNSTGKLCYNISHGIKIRMNPVLWYLWKTFFFI